MRARDVVPRALHERARVLLARRLAQRARASKGVVGAALVLHGVAPLAGDPSIEIEPPYGTAWLHAFVGELVRSYRLVRASELLVSSRGRSSRDPVPIAVTFDDDLRSHLDHAAPVLARHGVTATAFVGGISEPAWWQTLQVGLDRDELRTEDVPGVDPALVRAALSREPRAARRLAAAVERLTPSARDRVAATLRRFGSDVPPPLGLDGIRRLADAGWEIGFHTRRHDVLPDLGDDALRAALVDGRAHIERAIDASLSAIAYPHGKAGAREAGLAAAAGFAVGFTGAAEIVTSGSPPMLIGRLQPDRSSPGRALLGLARALQVGV